MKKFNLIFFVLLVLKISTCFSNGALLDGEKYYNSGIKYYNSGNYSKAISYLKKAIGLEPNNSKYYTALGNLYYKIKKYKDAIDYWEKAKKINPEDIEASENLKNIYKRIEGEPIVIPEKEKQENRTESKEVIKSKEVIISPKPSSESLSYAQKELEQALAFAPDNADIHFNLALIYIEKNNLEKAIFHFEKSREIDKNDLTKPLYLGIAYLKIDKLDKAEQEFKKVIEINQKEYLSLSYLGLILSKQGQDDNAIEYFKKALKEKYDFFIPHLGIATIYTKNKKFLEAKHAWEEAKRLYSVDSNVYNNLGYVYAQLGALDLGIENFKSAIEKDRNNTLAYYNLGLTYIKKGDIKQGIEIWEKLLILDPRNSDIHYNLGILYENIGDIDKAIQQYKKALSLEPSNVPAQSNFANAVARKTLPYKTNFRKQEINLDYKCFLSYDNLPIDFPR